MLGYACLMPGRLQGQAEARLDTIERGAPVRLGLRRGVVERGWLAAPFLPGATSIAYCRSPFPACPPADGNPVVTRPTVNLIRLDVRRGNTLKGALLGGGAVLAIIFAGRAVFSDRDAPAPLTRGRALGMITLVGVGALAGSQLATGWESVPLEPEGRP